MDHVVITINQIQVLLLVCLEVNCLISYFGQISFSANKNSKFKYDSFVFVKKHQYLIFNKHLKI